MRLWRASVKAAIRQSL